MFFQLVLFLPFWFYRKSATTDHAQIRSICVVQRKREWENGNELKNNEKKSAWKKRIYTSGRWDLGRVCVMWENTQCIVVTVPQLLKINPILKTHQNVNFIVFIYVETRVVNLMKWIMEHFRTKKSKKGSNLIWHIGFDITRKWDYAF